MTAGAEHERRLPAGGARLGASITVGTCLIPALLKDFEGAMPQVETPVHVTNTHTIEEMLLNSQLDLAVVEGEISSRI